MTESGSVVMREFEVAVPLSGVRLIDAGTGTALDLGTLSGVTVLSLIRHRY